MVILGIDPGYATVGYGVIRFERGRFQVLDYGAVTSPAGMEFPARLQVIYEGICELCDRFQPDCMAVEELFFNTNITTCIRFAEAIGVIIMCAHKLGIKISEYTPLQVKQAVVGFGRAEKKQVIDMVTRLLCLPKPPKPDDTADALAIAICHAHTGYSRISAYYNLK